MKKAHRLSLMVLTVLTVAFLAVDLPLMAQMGGQQRAPQQQKGAQQGAPRGAGTAQIDKSSPKLSPQQQQRVKQLQQQAQNLFRNLQQVLGELQRLPKPGTQGLGGDGDPIFGKGTDFPAGQPKPRGPQQRPGPQPGTRGLAESDDPDGAKQLTDKERAYLDGTSNTIGASTNRQGTSNPSGGVVDGDRIAQTGRNDAAYIKIDGLVKQAQQIVNNLEGIGNEAKALGFLTLDGKGNDLLIFNLLTAFAPQQLQQMGKELEKFGVIWTGKVE
jgi:hypothetical protein